MESVAIFIWRRIFTFTAVAMPLWAVALVFFDGDFSLPLFWIVYAVVEFFNLFLTLKEILATGGSAYISAGYRPKDNRLASPNGIPPWATEADRVQD